MKNKIIIRVIFIVVYCVISAEVFLRIMAPQSLIPRYVCATPYGIRGNTPNKTYWHIGPEYYVKLHTNSRGIRADREIAYEKPAGMKRIVLLGDSFGMGYEVNYEDMFSTRLESYLNQTYGVDIEVVNLSTSGHGNAEELIVLQSEGLKYSPDLVILSWHTTDDDDNVRSNLYGLENGQLYRKDTTYLPAVKIRERLERIPFYCFLEQYSHLYSFFREYAGTNIKKLLAAVRSGQTKPSSAIKSETKSNYSADLTLALLSEIKKVCTEHKIEFMILDIPVRKSRTSFYSSFPVPKETAEKICHFYSPIGDFGNQSGQKIYWEKGHGHFTPFGSDVVGQGLADYIGRNQLLKEQSSKYTTR